MTTRSKDFVSNALSAFATERTGVTRGGGMANKCDFKYGGHGSAYHYGKSIYGLDPYTDEQIAGAAAAVEGRSELDALVAYLQELGTNRRVRR